MSEITEQQVVELAFERLPLRDAQIFTWHHYGRPATDDKGHETISGKWTFSELSLFFGGTSFSTITKSLRQSAAIMLTAVAYHRENDVEMLVSDDSSADFDFRIYLQMSHHSVPRIDVTAKSAVLKVHKMEMRGAA